VTDPAADVRAWLEPRADEMAALLEELVAIETENPPGRGLGRCGRALHGAMGERGLSPELIELAPSRALEEPCIVRAEVGEGPRTLYFHGHFDVVPAQDPAQFRPLRRGGRIIGRGTADMKGGLVSMLYGALAARELGLLGDRRVVLHFVPDEETGSDAGSGHLREAGMIDPRALAMITAEPTGGVVWHACRGAITLRVRVRGREAHVGQAHLGINAFERMLRVAEPLGALAQELLAQRTAFPMDGDEARGSMLVVGGATGSGANFNVVPGSAWFSVDRRFNPEERLDEELARLTDTIARAAADVGAEVRVEVLQRAPSAATDASHPMAVMLARCVEEVEGSVPRFELCPGTLELRWYAQLGIPAFAYGAGRLDVSHGPDELIDEAALRRCAAVYALLAHQAGAVQPTR
jgi:acetylornithine deacetylase/succinyl-diaminopimelate desuccinylase-like protein